MENYKYPSFIKRLVNTLNKVMMLARLISEKLILGNLKFTFKKTSLTQWIKERFVKNWRNARKKKPWDPSSNRLVNGVNLIGYFKTAKGVSEAAHSSALALRTINIPHTVNDYEFGIPVSQQINSVPFSPHGNGFKFNTNLIHVNPPQLPFLWYNFKKRNLTGRYNIGVWYWELPNIPDEWCFAFDLVDEIWVATQFVFESISAKSCVPVVKIPPCITPAYIQELNRSDYNLPSDCFLFMCAYDVLSIQERKNPKGAVDAFQRAFAHNDRSVGLVIKVNNAMQNQTEIQNLRYYLNGYSNCYIIDEVFDKPKMNSLLNVIDVYISLHRSEGFGLIPAEAMFLGKPVVMTNWSGTVDFMTTENSCGVNYNLIPVRPAIGPYTSNQFWADPDVDHAAQYLQRLYSDKSYYSSISQEAMITIRKNYSPELVGGKMHDRLSKLGLI